MSEHDQHFKSFDEWVNKGRSWLTRRQRINSNGHPYNHAVCFDAKGRLVECGGDFMRARDEGAFPVRWLWPDQIAEIGNSHPFFQAQRPIEEDRRADTASQQAERQPDTSSDIEAAKVM